MSLGDDLKRKMELQAVERQEAFEQSTLKLVLLQIGCPRPKLRGFELELVEAFGWSWFNDLSWLPFSTGSVRIPEFNFEQLWLSPRQHEITRQFHDFQDEHPGEVALVFRCFGLGRLVATNVDPGIQSRVRIQIPGALGYRDGYGILPFNDFFTQYKREPDEF